MTKWQQLSTRLLAPLMGLIFGAGFLGFFSLLSRLMEQHHLQQSDQSTQIAVVCFSLFVGTVAFVLTRWLNADTVVEFSCDGSSLRFRKVRSEHAETRCLSEIT